MTERSSGTGQHGGAAESARRGADESTNLFAADGKHEQHETTHVERPNVPVGSGAPPWQRVQSPSDGGPAHEPFRRPGPVVADQPTVAEQRPSYPPPGPNGAPQNPFLTPKEHAGPPPPRPGGRPPMPFGGPGPVPVGGPSGPAGPAARPLGARPTARPAAPVPRSRPIRAPRKASLQIRRFDPWSVLKLSLVLSVAMFLMWLVAVGVLYGVLDGMGVWDKLNGAYSDLASVNDETGGESLISAGRVFSVSAVVGVVNIVLFTAFATVSAFVYNVSADLAGGIEVTLSERD